MCLAALNGAATIPVVGQAAKMTKAGVGAFELATKASPAAFKLASTDMLAGKVVLEAGGGLAAKAAGAAINKVQQPEVETRVASIINRDIIKAEKAIPAKLNFGTQVEAPSLEKAIDMNSAANKAEKMGASTRKLVDEIGSGAGKGTRNTRGRFICVDHTSSKC